MCRPETGAMAMIMTETMVSLASSARYPKLSEGPHRLNCHGILSFPCRLAAHEALDASRIISSKLVAPPAPSRGSDWILYLLLTYYLPIFHLIPQLAALVGIKRAHQHRVKK